MKVHELKTDPAMFTAVDCGEKTFEIRKNDRNFQPGDYLHLRKTVATGKEMAAGAPLRYQEDWELLVKVIYVLNGPIYGLSDGWCIMSIQKCS
jgi:tRNA-binding EMAP/Myf-like protein